MPILTTTSRLDLAHVRAMTGTDAIMDLVSRIQDERDENRASDHWHPEIAAPLDDELRQGIVDALERAGVTFAWQRP